MRLSAFSSTANCLCDVQPTRKTFDVIEGRGKRAQSVSRLVSLERGSKSAASGTLYLCILEGNTLDRRRNPQAAGQTLHRWIVRVGGFAPARVIGTRVTLDRIFSWPLYKSTPGYPSSHSTLNYLLPYHTEATVDSLTTRCYLN